jgi:hypothetical protein
VRARFPDIVTTQLSREHHRGGEVIPLAQVQPFEPDAIVVSTADCAISVGAAAEGAQKFDADRKVADREIE